MTMTRMTKMMVVLTLTVPTLLVCSCDGDSATTGAKVMVLMANLSSVIMAMSVD